jgi:hypothetical protein
MNNIYHRVASPTQPRSVAKLQIESQEIWGKVPRNGAIPKVEAYVGPLPANKSGIEFTTDLPPDRGCNPGYACWSGPREGVRVEEDDSGIEFAKIAVTITRCNQFKIDGSTQIKSVLAMFSN